MPQKHDAFISYSHGVDATLAADLERGLERLAKPTFRLRAMDVFRDKSSLAAAPGLWERDREFRQRRVAEMQRDTALSRQPASVATEMRVQQPRLSLQLAAQACASRPTAEAATSLLRVLHAAPFERIELRTRVEAGPVRHDRRRQEHPRRGFAFARGMGQAGLPSRRNNLDD